MRPLQLAYRLCAAGLALSVMVNRAIGEELEAQLPRVVTCPLAPHNLPPPSHYGTLSVSVIDETSSTIAIVPDYLMGVPEDRWERWPARVTQTPHYWLLVPSDMSRPTLMLMKHLDQPGVALGVLEPPLYSSHYIRCWIPRDRQ